ncbi:MAG: hypothetical protein RMI78_05775, partial [Nitrososphaerota archaeon]|nr:hypothetical protein [Nitrososphaerota archaeon]
PAAYKAAALPTELPGLFIYILGPKYRCIFAFKSHQWRNSHSFSRKATSSYLIGNDALPLLSFDEIMRDGKRCDVVGKDENILF